jgi:hypothetical protein
MISFILTVLKIDSKQDSASTPFQSIVNRLQSISFRSSASSPTSATILQSFTQLRTLKLWIELPFNENAFSGEYRYDGTYGSVRAPPLNHTAAEGFAMGFWRQIHKDERAKLEELEICFVRMDIQDRMQGIAIQCPVRLRRLPDGKKIGDVDFSMTCQSGWAGSEE